MSSFKFWAVIPASGIGSRMQADRPKQYLPFAQSTVIETTVNQLLDFDRIEGVILVLNSQDSYWESCDFKHDKPVHIAIGAAERSGSVLNGLKKLSQQVDINADDVWVMIHDAVRPCITHDDLNLLCDEAAACKDGLFLAHPVADTLKQVNEQGQCMATVDRECLWRAFTPQVFPFELIRSALEAVMQDCVAVTDDVSAVQHLGYQPKVIMGRSDNIKLTYPQDISIAETILQNQKLA